MARSYRTRKGTRLLSRGQQGDARVGELLRVGVEQAVPQDEIGLGDSHDGIMVLPPDTKVGTPLAALYPSQGDTVFEIGLTANRADAMSHYGVARDLAAYLNLTSPSKATLPALKPLAGTDATGAIALGDVDAARCIRYCGLTLRGVKVTSSPAWMQEALQAIGVRPINNVVDITNYVMMAYGQPMHCFDADMVKGLESVYDRARLGTYVARGYALYDP